MPSSAERRTRRYVRTWATSVALVVALAAGVSGCGLETTESGGPPRDAPRPAPLAPSEVKEYRGTDLSSLDDFRENSIEGPQQVDRESYRLAVTGLVDTPLSLTYDEVVALPAFVKVVRLDCVEGWSVTILWEGTRMKDLLERAGVKKEGKIVIFRAVDGYSTSLPLDYLLENDILVAWKMNGVELPPERGFPLQLVAEDRWGYKWIKWIESMEVSDDIAFRGYWEQRGYSNEGRRDESSRE